MKKLHIIIVLSVFVLCSACNLPSQQEQSQLDAEIAATQAYENALAIVREEASVDETILPEEEPEELMITRGEASPAEEPVEAVLPTADPNRVPPELPAVFQSDVLNKLDTPHTYVEDACTLIKNRWGAGKAEPGTVVMAIMYHSIVRGDTVNQDNAITVEQHKHLMQDLHDQGFTAINMDDFIGFITENDYIPSRSVLLIVDDRHSEENYSEHFLPYYEQWGWPVINAWISAEGTSQDLWNGNAHAEAMGYVDHQAHGVVHNENMLDSSTDEFLIGELKGSRDAIEAHFNKTPHAVIWPGGGFGYRPIEIAKEYGYKVAFTVNPRGPIMYNWVPLCDEKLDPTRPSFMMDGSYDPLFVLPRYWDTDAAQHIDDVRQMSKAAKEYLNANKATELEYYDIVCKPVMGDL